MSKFVETPPATVQIGEADSRKTAVPSPPLALVLLAFAAVYIIWGSTYLTIRLAIDSIPPLLMAGSRFLLAGSLLYGIVRIRGAVPPTWSQWGGALFVGGMLLLAGNGAVTWAEQSVPTAITALVVASVPLWTVLVEWLRRGGSRPGGSVVLGLIAGFAGVTLIVVSRGVHGVRLVDPVSAVVLLLGSICWAAGSVYSRHVPRGGSALQTVAMQMIAGGALLLLFGFSLGEAGEFEVARITAASAWAFLYLALMGSLVGFTAYIWLLQVSTPARVSTYAYVNPLIAVVLGRLVLGEALPAQVLGAGALILAAVVLITKKRGK